MYKKICFQLFVAALLCGKLSYAQNPERSVIAGSAAPGAKLFCEKLYLHTDHDVFVAGEILWYKAYLIDAVSRSMSTLSNVVYIELADDKQVTVLKAQIDIKNGVGSGSLYLPVTLRSGRYTLRGYSNWMKNFGEGCFYRKEITVVNSLADPGSQQVDASKKYDLQFFPEGGNLIAGLDNRVAFRAADRSGKGVDFEGTIVDDKNNVVATFKPFKFGIGNFNFKPEPGLQYKAKIKVAGGDEITAKFLEAAIKGYTMQVTGMANNQVNVVVRCNIPGSKMVHLLVNNRGQTTNTSETTLKDNVGEFLIDNNKLNSGVSSFTICNDQMLPVCERLYFKRQAQNLSLDLTTDRQDHSSRQKVTVNIASHTGCGQPVPAEMSISVIRANSLDQNAGDNIESYFELTSDLKGRIESPGYYFQIQNDEVDQAMDNLMMVNGWRKFKWDNRSNIQPENFNYEPEYEMSIITATVVNKLSGQPAPGVMASLSVMGANTHLYGAKSDLAGRVSFYTKPIYGKVKLALTCIRAQDSIYRIQLDTSFVKYAAENNSFDTQPTVDTSSLLDRMIGMQVQNLYTAEKLNRTVDKFGDTSPFYGETANKKYDLDAYTRFTNMHDVLSEYVEEVFINKTGQNIQFTLYDVLNKKYAENTPLILLDGVPVIHPEQLIKYDPLKVKQIEVVSKDYLLGPLSFGGILNLTTYKKSLEGFALGPNVTVADYEGLQFKREFYSPLYETPDAVSSRMPDLRELLYWSADVKTNNEGKTQISFYTSDRKGKYFLILQGTDGNGRFGSVTKAFNVVK